MHKTIDGTVHANTGKASMSVKDFQRLSEFIHNECGIRMPESKRIMLESRLQKRLRVLKIDSFNGYCDYLFSPEGMNNELIHMIDVVTTNKTDFFREPKHFDYLVQQTLPELMSRYNAGISRDIMIWSAGCSTGEEPYTLAMVLNEFAEKCAGFRFRFLILATDISSRVLEKAKQAIYEHDRVAPIPIELKKKISPAKQKR